MTKEEITNTLGRLHNAGYSAFDQAHNCLTDQDIQVLLKSEPQAGLAIIAPRIFTYIHENPDMRTYKVFLDRAKDTIEIYTQTFPFEVGQVLDFHEQNDEDQDNREMCVFCTCTVSKVLDEVYQVRLNGKTGGAACEDCKTENTLRSCAGCEYYTPLSEMTITDVMCKQEFWHKDCLQSNTKGPQENEHQPTV